MTSDKVEKYRSMAKRLLEIQKAEDALLDEMDTVWFSMSKEELEEVKAYRPPNDDGQATKTENHG